MRLNIGRLLDRIAKPIPVVDNMASIQHRYDINNMNKRVDELEFIFRSEKKWKVQ